jgi:hypothetical protein
MSVNVTIYGGSHADAVDIGSWTADQKHPLGTMAIGKDGSIYRYCQAGAADLVVGNIVQKAAPIPLHLALTSAAMPIGQSQPALPIFQTVVTPGATAGAANLYAEGYLLISDGPGNGYRYTISGHPAIVASTAFTLTLEEPIRDVAFTTATRYGLIHHNYKNVIQTPTTITAPVVGGVVAPIVATNYGWLLTKGLFAALINGTPAVTAPVINSATTAGGVDVWTAGAQPTANIVGRMAQVGVSGKNNAIYLSVD